MTEQQTFAAHAMQGMLAHDGQYWTADHTQMEVLASRAWEVAAAMLEERHRRDADETALRG